MNRDKELRLAIVYAIGLAGIFDRARVIVPGPALHGGAFSFGPVHATASLVERVMRLSSHESRSAWR